jgi:hypothetical protein
MANMQSSPTPTEPASPALEAKKLVSFPPLTKSTSPLTLFPHLRRAAEAKEVAQPKGLLAGDPIAPLTWDQVNADPADKSVQVTYVLQTGYRCHRY